MAKELSRKEMEIEESTKQAVIGLLENNPDSKCTALAIVNAISTHVRRVLVNLHEEGALSKHTIDGIDYYGLER